MYCRHVMDRRCTENIERISRSQSNMTLRRAAECLKKSNSHRKCDICAKLRIHSKSFHSSFTRSETSSSSVFSSRRSKSKRLFFTLFLFYIFHNCPKTYSAVTRVPDFLDLEGALHASKCAVREQIVNVRREHPSLPTEATLMPSCVALNRCSGCCQSEEMRCVPTSTYTTRVEISQTILFPDPSYEEITLEFTHHAACACKSADDTTPVCVQKACEDGETWSEEECSCVTSPSLSRVPQTCQDGEIWNEELCQCEVPCQYQPCQSGEDWDWSTCSCVRSASRIYQFPRQFPCPFGKVWDRRQCVLKCPAQNCGEEQIWNPHTCRCQCKPCHPMRMYRIRFNQNMETCQCACRSERKGRAACHKRGAEFNTSTCTCDYTYASHRGRRG